MPRADSDLPRVLQLEGECVCCVDVSAQRLLWCSHRGGVSTLNVWWCNKELPRAAPLAELGFTPSIISSFQEKILALGEGAVTLLVLEQITSVLVDSASLEVREEGELNLTEEFLYSDIVSDATHVAWMPDGAGVAISSPEKLVLLDCRIGCDDLGAPCPYMFVCCSSWYGNPGAAFTSYGVSRMFVLSVHNHLVSARYDDCFTTTPIMERDGHIIAGAHRVTCFAVGGGGEGHLIIGLSDGTARLLQQDTLEVFFMIDVTKHLYRMREMVQRQLEIKGGEVAVLNVVMGRRFIVVVRPDAVVYYDRNSVELLNHRTTFLSGQLPMLSGCSEDGSWCVWLLKRQEFLYVAAAPELPKVSSSLVLATKAQYGEEDDMVHARAPLQMRLLEPMRLPSQQQQQKKPTINKSSTGVNGIKSGKITNQKNADHPVTFGRPIKSSGYAAEVPWSVQQREKKLRGKSQKRQLPPLSDAGVTLRYKAVSKPWKPFRLMTAANNILSHSPIHSAAVVVANFSAGGAALLTASFDGSANLLKYPVVKNGGDGIMMRAHKTPLNTADVSLSINAPIVATGSTDGLVAMWQPCKREAPYITQTVGKEVRAVKFFYTDKFLCYASGNTVTLSRYAFDDGGGELHRNRNESKMESVMRFNADSAQHVVALDAINYFTSNLILWAGSNKSVGVYDVSMERMVQVVEEAHTRPIHHLSMMTASRYAAPSTGHLHMYLTAGLDSTVRIWDLRQRRSVRQLALHRNNATPVGVAFSPNGALVAVGCETSTVYVYDVSSGTTIDRVTVGDVPTAISWHPIEHALAVGTAAGIVKLMGQM